MQVPLKDQELKLGPQGIVELPRCPTCKERPAQFYNDVRQQFQCGECFYADYRNLEAMKQKEALAMLERLEKESKCNHDK